jgi:hypothetical protein
VDTYGGGGYAVNTALGMRSYPFAGWLLQRQLTKRFTLGGEVFSEGAISEGGRSSTFLDVGGYYNLKGEAFQLLFMLGHTVAGERQTVGYLGLYWTWGSKAHGEPLKDLTPETRGLNADFPARSLAQAPAGPTS